MIHIDKLQYCQYKKSGNRVRQYVGAGGEELPLEPYVVDVAFEISSYGMLNAIRSYFY